MAKRSESASGHPSPNRVPLGSVGETAFTLQWVDHPWELGVDAFTVPAGVNVVTPGQLMPTLRGGLATELAASIGGERFGTLEKLVAVEAERSNFGPECPVYVALPDNFQLGGSIKGIFIATASGPLPSVGNAAVAASAIARLASTKGIKRLALSLLGSGAARLDSVEVAAAMIDAVMRVTPLTGIQDFTFTTLSKDVMANAARFSDRVLTEAIPRFQREGLAARQILFEPGSLEPHVRSALHVASALAGEATAVDPVHVVRAVVSLNVGDSEAFKKLREFVNVGPDESRVMPKTPALVGERLVLEVVHGFHDQLNYALGHDNIGNKSNRALWGRDLIAAALLADGVELDSWLVANGQTLANLRRQWYEYVTSSDGGRGKSQWEAWWSHASPSTRQGQTTVVPPQAPLPDLQPQTGLLGVRIANAGSDDPWATGLNDRLGVGDEARAFARLMAAKRFRPPLAIGVFGEWGAGKSFFMRLMHEHVESLANPTLDTEAMDPNYVDGVVQIRFNAWHYVETNLWASLVDHLFSELDRWIRIREQPEEPNDLLERLSTARELTLEAAEELARRRMDQRDAARRVKEAERALQEARRSATTSPAVYLTAIEAVLNPKQAGTLGPEDKRQLEALRSARTKLESASEALGIHDILNNAREFSRVSRALAGEARRGQLLMAGISHVLQSGWFVALFVLVCLAMPAVYVFSADHVRLTVPVLEWLRGRLMSVGGALSSIAAILGLILGKVRWSIFRLETAKRALDEAIDKKTTKENDIFGGEQALLDKRTAEVEEARVLLVATGERVAEAAREYAGGTGIGRLRKFIRERATDGHYARHLGLVSTIRKDFEELAASLTTAAERASSQASAQPPTDVDKARAAFKSRVDQLIARCGDVLSEDEKSSLSRSGDFNLTKPVASFQRVILYIDDLDRCPPNKVIDVLQAIHLLLTFPLFVVVVAVDVRWVCRALEKYYPDLLDVPEAASAIRVAAANAHDYLEKIFQVPYWVRPMGEEGSRALLDERLALLNRVAQPSLPLRDFISKGTQTFGSDVNPKGDEQSERNGAVTSLEPSTEPVSQVGGSNTIAPHGTQLASAPDRPKQTPASIMTSPVEIDEDECAFVHELAPFVGDSPRRALRFLNVYCIVKGSLSGEDLVQLREGGFKALMTQLAIATGAPELLDPWLTALHDSGTMSLAELRKTLGQQDWLQRHPDRRHLNGALDLYERLKDNDWDVVMLRKYTAIARRYSFIGSSVIGEV